MSPKVRYTHLRYPNTALKICGDESVAEKYMTTEYTLVTCPRCLKFMERMR